MKEWKAAEKEAQKMTRDGAISVNMVTGEASHVSDRAPEQDYSPSGDSAAFVHSAAERLDDRRILKSKKKKRRNRRKAYREGTAANSRPSSRLQFTEEERAAPELQKAIRKSDKAADKLDAARAAVPKKRVLGTERVFDEASGAGRTRLVFHETDKPASIRQPGPSPLTRPLQEVAHAAHAKVREVEQENSGVAAGHLTERGMEKAVGYGNRKLQNWRAERQVKPWRDAAKAEQAAVRANAEALYQKALHDNPQLASGSPISRIWQKKRMQRQYAAAYRASRGAEGAKAATQTAAKSAKKGAEAAKKAGEFIARHKKAFLMANGTQAYAVRADAPERDNPLRTAEMTLEDDYGMIDGVINNGRRGEELEKAREHAERTQPEKKPSIRERLAAAKQECAKQQPRPAPEKKPPELGEL